MPVYSALRNSASGLWEGLCHFVAAPAAAAAVAATAVSWGLLKKSKGSTLLVAFHQIDTWLVRAGSVIHGLFHIIQLGVCVWRGKSSCPQPLCHGNIVGSKWPILTCLEQVRLLAFCCIQSSFGPTVTQPITHSIYTG